MADTQGVEPPVASVKWHPGHYVLGMKPDEYRRAHIAALAGEPNIMGWEQLVSWGRLEPSRGRYDWELIDALLEDCRATGKHLIVQVLDRSFGGASTARLPPYLADEPGAGGGWYVKPNGGVVAKIWLSAVMDRLIALYQAIGRRYDANPYFEGVFTAESDVGFARGPEDYSATTWLGQLHRILDALPQAYPHTNVWLSVNFVQAGHGSIADLIEHARKNRIGISGPDAITRNPDHSDPGSRTLRGLKWSGHEWLGGGRDYRGVIAIAHDVETPELGGKMGRFTPDEIYRHSFEVNGDSHLIWARKDFPVSREGTDLFWSRDILPWLEQAGHPTHTQCPSSYTGGCNTG